VSGDGNGWDSKERSVKCWVISSKHFFQPTCIRKGSAVAFLHEGMHNEEMFSSNVSARTGSENGL
jgi:hypothetical protein